MASREVYDDRRNAVLLLLPTIVVCLVFLYYPAVRAFGLSFFDATFGQDNVFVGTEHYLELLTSSEYHYSVLITILFGIVVVVGVMAFSLFITFLIHEVDYGQSVYLIASIWPYALPPAVAGLVFLFLVHPTIGIATTYIELSGITVNWFSNGWQAFVVVTVATIWKQIGYNIIFMIASMNNIPEALTETANLDGVGRTKRLLWVYVPIMSPTLFFLVIMNTIYAFFNTFAFIDLMTSGGPANSTNILIYDLYREAFQFFDFGLASAKSVVLFVVVGVLMYVQFKFTDEYAHYGG